MGEQIIKRKTCDITGRGHKDGIRKYTIRIGTSDGHEGIEEVMYRDFEAGETGLDSLKRAIDRKLSGPKKRIGGDA